MLSFVKSVERITAEEPEEERTEEERRVDSKVEVAEVRNGRNGEKKPWAWWQQSTLDE